ncbi:Hpt domain-containing protein, partial [Magnetococcales bacterium HHB-1]
MSDNQLLDMFVAEARDLLENISKGLLALESAPGDASIMNSIFRALHTLKGSSGLFEPDLDPIRRVAHAGEDLLDAVRNNHLPFDSNKADLLLDSLDTISQWLDNAESGEALTPEDETLSHTLASKLRALLEEKQPETAPPAPPETPLIKAPPEKDLESYSENPAPEWINDIPETQKETIQERLLEIMDQLMAIRYIPDSQCFFTGEDPLHLVRQTPGLLTLYVDNPEPWPPASEWDPYQCTLRFILVSDASEEEIRHRFRYVENQTDIIMFDALPATPPTADSALENSVTATTKTTPHDPAANQIFAQIIDDQLEILNLPISAEIWEERMTPMAHLLKNLFTRQQMSEELRVLEETLIIAKQKHSFAALRTFLETFKSTKTDQHNQSERLSPQQTAPEIQLSQEDQTRPPESEPPPVPTPVEPQRPLSTQETTLQAPR